MIKESGGGGDGGHTLSSLVQAWSYHVLLCDLGENSLDSVCTRGWGQWPAPPPTTAESCEQGTETADKRPQTKSTQPVTPLWECPVSAISAVLDKPLPRSTGKPDLRTKVLFLGCFTRASPTPDPAGLPGTWTLENTSPACGTALPPCPSTWASWRQRRPGGGEKGESQAFCFSTGNGLDREGRSYHGQARKCR